MHGDAGFQKAERPKEAGHDLLSVYRWRLYIQNRHRFHQSGMATEED